MRDLEPWRPFVQRALDRSNGQHSWEDIVSGVADGTFQIWTRPDGAIVTQVLLYPQFKQLFVYLAGGNLASIESMCAEIERWASVEHGCTRALFIGRPGWQRTFLNRTGWRTEELVYMEKDI